MNNVALAGDDKSGNEVSDDTTATTDAKKDPDETDDARVDTEKLSDAATNAVNLAALVDLVQSFWTCHTYIVPQKGIFGKSAEFGVYNCEINLSGLR